MGVARQAQMFDSKTKLQVPMPLSNSLIGFQLHDKVYSMKYNI